ncbi:MAG: Uncharacterised protein [Cellulomonadaceae bacterium TMED98]|nr:MAG: Uncharacterised protein [Cellulomonadaceae bacterium TMED98]
MGDIHNGHPAFGQALEHLQQVVGLRGGQRCGGLIQDQHLWLPGHSPGDFDELPQGHRQAGDSLVKVNRDTDFFERLLRNPLHLGSFGESKSGGGRSQQDVFCHRHFRNQGEFLMHEGDTGVDGLFRSTFQGDPVDDDGPGVLLVDTGQDAHERGFPGTVLADHCVNFSGVNGEGNFVDSKSATKTLDDVVGFDDGSTRGRCRCSHNHWLLCRFGSGEHLCRKCKHTDNTVSTGTEFFTETLCADER